MPIIHLTEFRLSIELNRIGIVHLFDQFWLIYSQIQLFDYKMDDNKFEQSNPFSYIQ